MHVACHQGTWCPLGVPPRTGEDVVADHCMAEKFEREPGPEPVLNVWKAKKQPSEAQVSSAQGAGGQACRCAEGI